MRDCMFYVADLNMEETFKGFLLRDKFYLSLGCGKFEFDPVVDITRAKGRADGGLWRHARILLEGYQQTHQRLVVCLDRDFGGSPGQEKIREDITRQLVAAGWEEKNFVVLVIDPELEQWIWQDSEHVERALKHTRPPTLREHLAATGEWPEGSPKPLDPKSTLQKIVDRSRLDRSSDLYGKITSRVSVKNCVDPEFHRFAETLRTWFPPEAAA